MQQKIKDTRMLQESKSDKVCQMLQRVACETEEWKPD